MEKCDSYRAFLHVSRLYPITGQCKTLALQNQKLAQARDLLLPRLMSGELAV
jgi:type I restriction enzyme S subunit